MANAFNVLSYGNYALFVVLAFLIIISSYIISHMVNAIERRTKYSGVLVAGTIVALISSLPEFTSSLVGIFTTHNPAVASGNLMGGNLFRTCMLAFTLLFFIPSIKYARTTVIQVSLILSQIGVFACYLIIIVLGNNIGDGHVETDVFHNIIFGVFSGLVVCLYIFNL
jgi:Ca2+/Na+ antiporter